MSRFGQARLKQETVPSLDHRVTYATCQHCRYFTNKELRNRVNTRGDRWQDCRYDCRADKGAAPPASRLPRCRFSTAVSGTTASNEYGGMEGRNVVSRTSVIYFDNRSSLLCMNIDVRLTSLFVTVSRHCLKRYR